MTTLLPEGVCGIRFSLSVAPPPQKNCGIVLVLIKKTCDLVPKLDVLQSLISTDEDIKRSDAAVCACVRVDLVVCSVDPVTRGQ